MSCTSHCVSFQKQRDYKREQMRAGLAWGGRGAEPSQLSSSQAWVGVSNPVSRTSWKQTWAGGA